MVRRLSYVLLQQAAYRWPAEDRAQLHQEWLAEMHVMNSSLDMLKFAGSLMLARPARRAASPGWTPVLHLLAAPFLIVALLIANVAASYVAVAGVAGFISGMTGADVLEDGIDYVLHVSWGLLLAVAWPLIRLARRWGAAGAVPQLYVSLSALLLAAAFLDPSQARTPILTLLIGLGIALLVATRWTRAGRPRLAWLAGAGVLLVTFEVASALLVLDRGFTGAMWAFANSPLLYPQAWLLIGAFGLAYTISAVQRREELQTVRTYC